MTKDKTVYCLSSVAQIVRVMDKVVNTRGNNMKEQPKVEVSNSVDKWGKMWGKMSGKKVAMNNVFIQGGTPIERAVLRIIFMWCRHQGFICRGGIDFHAKLSADKSGNYSMRRSDGDWSMTSWDVEIRSGMDIREFIRCAIEVNLYVNHCITDPWKPYKHDPEKTSRYVNYFIKNNDIGAN